MAGAARAARVFACRLPPETFEPYGWVAGHWVSLQPVQPAEMVEFGDLPDRHAAAGIELRIVPHLLPLWESVFASTLEFSGMRLRTLGTR